MFRENNYLLKNREFPKFLCSDHHEILTNCSVQDKLTIQKVWNDYPTMPITIWKTSLPDFIYIIIKQIILTSNSDVKEGVYSKGCYGKGIIKGCERRGIIKGV